MAAIDTSDIDVQILQTLVAPDAPTLTVPVARALVALSFTVEQEAEMHQLLDKNNAGTISADERQLLEAYVRVGNFLSLLKAKGRSTLSARSAKR